ncbi:MAG: hypothetical protein HC811_08490 [Flammeovirgaceae bacterium]|nr:hypothetical protein [Flammeovirgaceae bacterium]
MERLQAVESSEGPVYDQAYETYLATSTEANMQLEARLPLSDNARQMIALGSELAEQYEQFDAGWGEGGPEQTALEAKMVQEATYAIKNPAS